MLHDIHPHTLSNTFRPRPAQQGNTVLFFEEKGVYLCGRNFPLKEDYSADARLIYLFDYDGSAVFLSDRAPNKNGLKHPLNALRGLEQPLAFMGGTAQHLWSWYSKTRFCGCCGTEMIHSTIERAMICPKCGNTVYPRISPAVIMAITCGDKLLLAHGARFKGPMYSLIAGYLEIGESLEMAAAREALEETGLHIRNIRYFGNQPWPYTDSHMVGFFAEADESEPLCLQPEELTDAGWFTKDHMPVTPDQLSIASAMIDAWKNGWGK